MKLDARLTLFMYLVGIFLTCLLMGNLIGGKITSVWIAGREFPISVGEIPFPLTFVLTDILNEFYGRKTARRVTMLGFFMTALAFGIIQVAAAVPWREAVYEPGYPGMLPASFANVFLGAGLIQIASMVAFLTAQFVDIGVFFLIKKATGERLLWLRATGSTAVSQAIDTVVILTIAFGATTDTPTLINWMITSYVVKVVVAILMTPVIYAVHGFLERVWKIHPVELEPAGDVGGGPA